jgi:diguanylate cyclase (GGDEF)-like protein
VRYAGDEFIIVITNCSRAMADDKLRELQERIARVELETPSGKRMRLAASAGASIFPHDGTTSEALLADADHRMYRDKAARRGPSGAGRGRTIALVPRPAGEADRPDAAVVSVA